jgi:hypothetical protein
MPAYSCLLLSRRSPTMWHCAIPIHKVILFIVRGLLPSAAPVRFICTIAIVTLRDLLFVARPATGYTARTAPIIGILDILAGRYMYRYNFRPLVVTPLQQGSRHRHASSLSVYEYYNFSTSLSPLTSF